MNKRSIIVRLDKRKMLSWPLLSAIYLLVMIFAIQSNNKHIISYCLLFVPILVFFPIYYSNEIYWISFLLFFLYCACRKPLMIDDGVYIDIFDAMGDGWNSLLNLPEEKLFLLLNRLVAYFTSDYQIAQMLIIGFAILFFLIAVCKWKRFLDPFYMVSFYFFYILLRCTVSGLNRIQLAIPFYILMLYLVAVKKKYLIGIIILLLGSAIHLSFLISVLIYIPVIADKIKKEKIDLFYLSLFITTIVLILLPIAIRVLVSFLPTIKYSTYGQFGDINFSYFTLLLIVVFVYMLFFKNKLIIDMESNEKLYTILMCTLEAGIFFEIFLSGNAMGRACYYLLFSIPLLFSQIKSNYNILYSKVSSYIMFVAFMSIYFIATQILNTYTLENINNYQNYFLG